ncbi:hypothetical protein LAZ67_X003856 [Cordylochernes scorpioides]|uniref:Uncharacterized protein n=1 Tax=Cordylochernes scorpioides TaxID=51811 RepID=A0ABY6LUF1_9ARAC|nr:hypothetical protein LAZ67_X003856 [Cordylochernes scorpioides]
MIVQLKKSANGSVVLRKVTPSAAGTYRCEVSADAPSFQTAAADRVMIVEGLKPSKSSSGRKGHWILAELTFVILASYVAI